MENFKLLSKVKAILQTAKGIETTTGYVTSTYLDDFGNVVCRLQTADGTRNVQIACINPSIDTRARYKALCKKVKHITTLGNDEVKAVVSRGNDKIKALEAAFTGGTLEIPEELAKWVEEQKQKAQGEQQSL